MTNSERSRRTPETVSPRVRRNRLIATAAIVATLTGGAIGGAYGYAMHKAFPDKPKVEGELPYGYNAEPNITSVAVEGGAKIRSDPNVPGRYDPDNTLYETVTEIEVPVVNHDGQTRDGDSNPDWNSVTIDEVRAVSPELADKLSSDSDGRVWISEAKSSHSETDQATK
ncbi:hypothetical protein HGB25_00560 [Candidatus Saccharibacteria bacterium]|nr:hypothetical protein [Candidatus Saccharibacteria bacterium]